MTLPSTNRSLVTAALAAAIFASALASARADWPRFRGPNGSGVSTGSQQPPTTWSPQENIRWKVALPGPGVSSPIVVGDRVFVTCYSGYGLDRSNPGNIEDLKRHLVCVDRLTGDILWDQTIDAVLPEDRYSGAGVPTHGYASHTPVSDGQRVYVFFGKTGALAFDLEGNRLWQTSVGTESDPARWGSSSSPILYRDVLIVTASAESQALVGLDTETGEELWRAEGWGLSNTWGTPVLAQLDDRAELVIGVPSEVWGLDPQSGDFNWYAPTAESEQASASVVTDGDVVFIVAGGGRGAAGGAAAVRAGGSDNAADAQILWRSRGTTRFATPLLHNGKLYVFNGSRIVGLDSKTGETVIEARIETSNRPGGGGGPGGMGGSDFSSPVMAGNLIYYVTNSGETIVFRAGETLEQVASNLVTEDRESFMATPAISDGALFLRSNEHLYCVAADNSTD